MKLKVYRFSLLGALIASLSICILFLIKAIISISTNTTDFDDEIMIIVCLALTITFIGLEIFNTIVSFKNGSAFIKNLTFNDDLSLNRNLLYVSGGISILSLIAVVYFSLLCSNIELPLSDFSFGMKSVMLCFSIVLFIDTLFITLFPLVASEDSSLIE